MRSLILLAAIILSAFLCFNALSARAPSKADYTGGARTETDEKSLISTFANARYFDEENLNYLYCVDPDAYVTTDDLNLANLLSEDIKTDITGENEPKLLILHTHSRETFADSIPGDEDGTIIAVGQRLAEILADEYGVEVVHDVARYDVKDGEVNREDSYAAAAEGVKKLLNKYPSIEVVIDLHRDGVPDDVRLVTTINGKRAARIMFFNGITRLNDGGVPKATAINPYLKENLAFSLNLQLTANELYPGFARRIYIKPYRYNLHMKPKSVIVEVGANTNTLEEALNAMEPLAEIIASALF